MKKNDSSQPVDIVYTWVNGSDEKWLNKKKTSFDNVDKNDLVENGLINARFEDHEELRFSLRSIEENLQWVRKIFIVTDKQVPNWLNTLSPKIRIIDHSEIFPEYIKQPVFNSVLIEWYLYNIPGLAENFIYMNDDFFILKKMDKSYFFSESKATIHSSNFFEGDDFVLFNKNGVGENFYNFLSHLNSVGTRRLPWFSNTLDLISIEYDGKYKNFWLKHAPLALKKSILKDLLGKYETYIKTYMADKHFRSRYDISSQWLYVPYMLEKNNLNLVTDDVVFDYGLGSDSYEQKKYDILKLWDEKYNFLSVAQGEKSYEDWIAFGFNLLLTRFPHPSSFELVHKNEIKEKLQFSLINIFNDIYSEFLKLDNEVTSKSNIIEEQHNNINDLVSKNNKFQSEINLASIKIKEITNELDAAYSEIENKKHELDAAYSEIENKKHELDAAYSEIENKDAIITKISNGKLWKLMERYFRIRDFIKDKIIKFLLLLRTKVLKKDKKLINRTSLTEQGWKDYKLRLHDRLRNFEFKTEQINELVSIVLPVYNGQRYLSLSIESVLAQSYKNFELIIVNDGSKDESDNIIKKYLNDKRIKYINKKKNEKLPAALNDGFAASKGEFLTWTSADNIMELDHISKFVTFLNKHKNIGFTWSNMTLIDKYGEKITGHGWYESPKNSGIVKFPEQTFELNTVANNYVGAAFMYRRKAAILIGSYSCNRFGIEDYDYWMRLNELVNVRKINDDTSTYLYRFHDDSLTSQDKKLGITKDRPLTMVFDDYRRSEFFCPVLVEELQIKNKLLGQIFDDHMYQKTKDIGKYKDDLFLSAVNIIDEKKIFFNNQYLNLIVENSAVNLPSSFNADIRISSFKNKLILDINKRPYFFNKERVIVDRVSDLRNLLFALIKQKHNFYLEKRIKELKKNDFQKGVNLVICTNRHYKNIKKNLNKAYSLILNNDNCYLTLVINDEYSENIYRTVLKEFDSNKFSIIFSPIKGLSNARNTALSVTKHEIIYFIDDDALIEAESIESLLNFIPHDLGVVGGQILLIKPQNICDDLVKYREAYWSQFIPLDNKPYEAKEFHMFPYGANWAASTYALYLICGFRADYGRSGNDYAGGEELLAALQIKDLDFKIYVNPKMKVYHCVDGNRFTLKHLQKTAFAGILTNYRLACKGLLPQSDFSYENIQYNIQRNNGVLNKNNKYDSAIAEAQNDIYKEILKKYHSI